MEAGRPWTCADQWMTLDVVWRACVRGHGHRMTTADCNLTEVMTPRWNGGSVGGRMGGWDGGGGSGCSFSEPRKEVMEGLSLVC